MGFRTRIEVDCEDCENCEDWKSEMMAPDIDFRTQQTCGHGLLTS